MNMATGKALAVIALVSLLVGVLGMVFAPTWGVPSERIYECR